MLFKELMRFLGIRPQLDYREKCFLKSPVCVLCVDFSGQDVKGTSPCVYIVFPCVKHFNLPLVLWKFGAGSWLEDKRKAVWRPAETEALPPWVDKDPGAVDQGNNAV